MLTLILITFRVIRISYTCSLMLDISNLSEKYVCLFIYGLIDSLEDLYPLFCNSMYLSLSQS